MANNLYRMTAVPVRNNRLWQPARGILFSRTSTAPLPPPARSLPSIASRSIGVGQYRSVITSIGTQSGVMDCDPDQETTYQETTYQETTTVPPESESDLPSHFSEPGVQELDQEPEAEMEPEAETDPNAAPKAVPNEPPPHVLEFNMLDEKFYKAKEAPPGSKESYWSYELYRGPTDDGSVGKPRLHHCRNAEDMETVCQLFVNEKVLGFDMEWVKPQSMPGTLKIFSRLAPGTLRHNPNVSLVQIASVDRIALFHLAAFPSRDVLGPTFKRLMEDPNITKVGVAIKGDATRLRKHLDINCRGLLELSNLYKLVIHSRTGEYDKINRRLVTLATQVEEFLHLPLYKGDVRSSNWAWNLSFDQVRYAASDAYAGVQLFAVLEYYRNQLDPCPPCPLHAELNRAIELANGVNAGRADDPDAVDIEDDGASPAATKKKSTAPAKPRKLAVPALDSRVEVAQDWALSYRARHPGTLATLPALRAYYLWHYYDLSPEAVSSLLREPPLKVTTVVSYILGAINCEKLLPVDNDRLREIFTGVSKREIWTKFAFMLRDAPQDAAADVAPERA